jgi:hypothetical protein
MIVELTLFGEKAFLELPTYAPIDLAIAKAFQVSCKTDIYKELTVNGQYDKVEVKLVGACLVPQCNELVEKYGLSGLYLANPVLEHFENMSTNELAYDIAINGSPIQSSVSGIIHEWFECTKKNTLHLHAKTGSLVNENDVWYLDELGLGENA